MDNGVFFKSRYIFLKNRVKTNKITQSSFICKLFHVEADEMHKTAVQNSTLLCKMHYMYWKNGIEDKSLLLQHILTLVDGSELSCMQTSLSRVSDVKPSGSSIDNYMSIN